MVTQNGRQVTALQVLFKILKQKCDHRHPMWSFHAFVKIAYQVESSMRTTLNKQCSTARRWALVVACLEYALPLAGDVTTSFEMQKSKDGVRLQKRFALRWNFQPRPCSVLVKDTTESKKKKVKGSKRKSKVSTDTLETPTVAEAQEADETPTVLPPDPESLTTTQALSRVVDEGLWQLINKGFKPDEELDIQSKVQHVIRLFWKLSLSGGVGIDAELQNGVTTKISNIYDFRARIHEHLEAFASGYLLVRGHNLSAAPVVAGQRGLEDSPEMSPLPSPLMSPVPSPEMSPLPSPLASPDDSWDLLSHEQACDFLQWLAANPMSLVHSFHPAFRTMQTRVSQEALKLQLEIGSTWRSILKIIVGEVCKHICIDWMNEVCSSVKKGKSHEICFKCAPCLFSLDMLPFCV